MYAPPWTDVSVNYSNPNLFRINAFGTTKYLTSLNGVCAMKDGIPNSDYTNVQSQLWFYVEADIVNKNIYLNLQPLPNNTPIQPFRVSQGYLYNLQYFLANNQSLDLTFGEHLSTTTLQLTRAENLFYSLPWVNINVTNASFISSYIICQDVNSLQEIAMYVTSNNQIGWEQWNASTTLTPLNPATAQAQSLRTQFIFNFQRYPLDLTALENQQIDLTDLLTGALCNIGMVGNYNGVLPYQILPNSITSLCTTGTNSALSFKNSILGLNLNPSSVNSGIDFANTGITFTNIWSCVTGSQAAFNFPVQFNFLTGPDPLNNNIPYPPNTCQIINISNPSCPLILERNPTPTGGDSNTVHTNQVRPNFMQPQQITAPIYQAGFLGPNFSSDYPPPNDNEGWNFQFCGECRWSTMNSNITYPTTMFRLWAVPGQPLATLAQMSMAFGQARADIYSLDSLNAFISRQLLPYIKIRMTAYDNPRSVIGIQRTDALQWSLMSFTSAANSQGPFINGPEPFRQAILPVGSNQWLFRTWGEDWYNPNVPSVPPWPFQYQVDIAVQSEYEGGNLVIDNINNAYYQFVFDSLAQDFNIFMQTPGTYVAEYFLVRDHLDSQCAVPLNLPSTSVCYNIVNQYGLPLVRNQPNVFQSQSTNVSNLTTSSNSYYYSGTVGNWLSPMADATANFMMNFCNTRVDPYEVATCSCLFPPNAQAGVLPGYAYCFSSTCWSQGYLFEHQADADVCNSTICIQAINISGSGIFFAGAQTQICNSQGGTVTATTPSTAATTSPANNTITSASLFSDSDFITTIGLGAGTIVLLLLFIAMIYIIRRGKEKQNPPPGYFYPRYS